MRVLHTADWHIGHRFYNESQDEEHKLFLDWLLTTIDDQNIDVLVIAGDVFDTGSPSSSSFKLYYDFLTQVQKTKCKYVVISAGNHDSPSSLSAPKQLLSALNVIVIGKSPEHIEEEVLQLEVNGEEIIIAATPYLRDQDIRKAVAGEHFDEMTQRYKTALVNHYDKLFEYGKSLSNAPFMALGHLFAIGGSVSDSEQNIYVGTLGHIGADDFPAFDYIALGHLHKPQLVGKKNHIRYSGSPVILSFSEVGYMKKVLITDFNSEDLISIEEVEVPKLREVYTIKGDRKTCLDAIKSANSGDLAPFVEVTLDEKNDGSGYPDLMEACEEKGMKLLKIVLNQDFQTHSLMKYSKKEVRELTPQEVFEMKYKDAGLEEGEYDKFLDMYQGVVTKIREEQ